MKIIISNTVTLNGGDFAILLSIIKILKLNFGENTEIIVYDDFGDVAPKYFKGIIYRKHLYFKYLKKSTNKSSIHSKVFIKVYNIFTQKRFMLAARYYSKGRKSIANLLLSQQQKEDFYNYAAADLIISTGGTYLVENYDLHPRYFDYAFILALKKSLVFFTQSLGPFNKPENKRAIKEILDKASLIFLRDEASLNNLKAINVNVSKARVCADVVFADADPNVLKTPKSSSNNNSLRVAISVRDWKFFKEKSAREGMETYNKSIAALCEYITITLGGNIVFISTCQGIIEYGRDDSKTAKNIYKLLSEEAKSKTIVNREFHHPDELKELIKGFDVVISTRMHFAIQSLNMGIPVLPIAYEFKTIELFNKLMDKEYILDIDTINEVSLTEAFKKFMEALPALRPELFQQVERERQSALKVIDYMNEEL